MKEIGPSAEFDRVLLTPEYPADPYRYHADLRESDPICWSSQTNAWVLTRYQDVRAALMHPRLISGKRVESYADGLSPELKGELEPLFYQVGKWIGNMDPPDHKRLRKMVELAFTARMVEGLRPAIEGIARELLAKAAGKGEMDFVEDKLKSEFVFTNPNATAVCGCGQSFTTG